MKMRMILGRVFFPLLLAGLPAAGAGGETQVFREADTFLADAFGAHPPRAQVLWVPQELRQELEDDFGWRAGLRVRYWQDGRRTAWILDEIGKDQPITAGVVVGDRGIERVEVLVFRESRGWEVKFPFFTDQFAGATLASDRDLDRRIDGITGATLSVRAMTRMARVALRLHDETRHTTLARHP